MIIEFTIPGKPVGQGRPRFSRHRGYVQTYDPAKSRQYKAMATMCAQRVYSGNPLETPLKITVKAYFGLYKSYTKKRREACLSGQEVPTKKPDIDNIVKGIMDSLNGVIYHDDKQVIQLVAFKAYAEKPRVEVTVEELEQ